MPLLLRSYRSPTVFSIKKFSIFVGTADNLIFDDGWTFFSAFWSLFLLFCLKPILKHLLNFCRDVEICLWCLWLQIFFNLSRWPSSVSWNVDIFTVISSLNRLVVQQALIQWFSMAHCWGSYRGWMLPLVYFHHIK